MKVKSIALVTAGLFTSQAGAAPFYKECLSYATNPVGNPNINDRSITNDIELVQSSFNSKMRMSSIKTCFVEKADDQGEVEKHVTGVAIRLKDPDAEQEIELQ